MFEATEILPKHKDIIFLTLDDAVEAAHSDRKELTENGQNKVDIDTYSFGIKNWICNSVRVVYEVLSCLIKTQVYMLCRIYKQIQIIYIVCISIDRQKLYLKNYEHVNISKYSNYIFINKAAL